MAAHPRDVFVLSLPAGSLTPVRLVAGLAAAAWSPGLWHWVRWLMMAHPHMMAVCLRSAWYVKALIASRTSSRRAAAWFGLASGRDREWTWTMTH